MYQANNMQQLRFIHNIPDVYYIYLSYSAEHFFWYKPDLFYRLHFMIKYVTLTTLCVFLFLWFIISIKCVY